VTFKPASDQRCCGTCRFLRGDECLAGKVEWVGGSWWGTTCGAWSEPALEHISGLVSRVLAELATKTEG
jgi:hypothetical protein